MSIVAMNWAMRQATGSPSAQCVLYVLADVADSEGIAWPSVRYIAEHSQQSMDTARKRLKELEDAGYLVRFERHEANGRRTSDEIRLQLGDQAVSMDPPDPDDAGGGDSGGSSADVSDQSRGGDPRNLQGGDPRNLQGGPSPGTGGGPSQLSEGHSIEPSKEPPSPNPSHGPPDGGGPGAGQGSGGSEALAAFKAAYPIPTTHPAEVARLFAALTPEEQRRATLGALGYASFLKGHKTRKEMDMRKFLRERVAEEFVPYAPKPEPERAFVASGSPAFCAWRVLLELFTFRIDTIRQGEGPDGTAGAYLPPLPDGALVLADCVDVDGQIDQRNWIFVEHESPEWWAWSKRAQKWGGSLPDADIVDTGETYEQTLPGDRVETMPVRKLGLRFPSQWPPRLSGETSQGDEDGEAKNAD